MLVPLQNMMDVCNRPGPGHPGLRPGRDLACVVPAPSMSRAQAGSGTVNRRAEAADNAPARREAWSQKPRGVAARQQQGVPRVTWGSYRSRVSLVPSSQSHGRIARLSCALLEFANQAVR